MELAHKNWMEAKFVIKPDHINYRLTIAQWNFIFKTHLLEKSADPVNIAELIELFAEEIDECLHVKAHSEPYLVPNPKFTDWKRQSQEYCDVTKPDDLSNATIRSAITVKYKPLGVSVRDKYNEIMDWITANPKPDEELVQYKLVPESITRSETYREIEHILQTIETKLLVVL